VRFKLVERAISDTVILEDLRRDKYISASTSLNPTSCKVLTRGDSVVEFIAAVYTALNKMSIFPSHL
jgi:hypothetical protein